MKLQKEFKSIVDWANERGIMDRATMESQFIKLQEEVGELAVGILKRNPDDISDAIGDCVIVLTILAEMNGNSIENCINEAYNVIKERKGKMINGTFVKEK